jgi:hypothetical protein
MLNCSFKTFSVLRNLEDLIARPKQTRIKNIFEDRDMQSYDRSLNFYRLQCNRIYNEIENHYYTYKSLAIFVFYNHAFGGKFDLNLINRKEIIKVGKLFTQKQLKKDKEYIFKLREEAKIKLNQIYKKREGGTNILYELTIKKLISPLYYIKYLEKTLTNPKKDVILKSEEYKRFQHGIKLILKTLTGEIANE